MSTPAATSCAACRAPIVFLRKVRKDGTRGAHPVDASSVQPGDEMFVPERHVSHFDTCPEAWRFRRPAASPRSAKSKVKATSGPVQLGLFTERAGDVKGGAM